MAANYKEQLETLISDLNVLIEEMEANPHISTWVVHRALKSIKRKAEKAKQTAQPARG